MKTPRRRYATLAEYFENSGDTHEALATRLGISQPQVTRVTAGGSCSLALAKRLSAATGVPIEAIGPPIEGVA